MNYENRIKKRKKMKIIINLDGNPFQATTLKKDLIHYIKHKIVSEGLDIKLKLGEPNGK